MANLNSVNVTRYVASPATLIEQRLGAAHALTEVGTIETTPVAADTIQWAVVPVDAILYSLFVGFDDLASTSATMDVGFHQLGVGSAIGTVIDKDALIDGIDLDGANALADERNSVQGIETISERMWELANLSAKPDFEFMVITSTIAAATAGAAGTLSWRIVHSG